MTAAAATAAYTESRVGGGSFVFRMSSATTSLPVQPPTSTRGVCNLTLLGRSGGGGGSGGSSGSGRGHAGIVVKYPGVGPLFCRLSFVGLFGQNEERM